MTRVKETIEVECPIRSVYDQWTQFEDFPRFMDGVESVQQLDDTHLHWKASIGGVRREWDAEIIEQEPDRIISWSSTDGTTNRGTVRFTPAGSGRTTVDLELDFEPEGAAEKVGDTLGIVKARAKGDLKNFKEFIEDRVLPTGEWRGEVHGGRTTSRGASRRGR
jgi:uncharacterized membrane protein